MKKVEHVLKRADNKFYYQGITEDDIVERFNSFEKAKRFIDEYQLQYAKIRSDIYCECLVCYETLYDDIECYNKLYDKHFDISELEK